MSDYFYLREQEFQKVFNLNHEDNPEMFSQYLLTHSNRELTEELKLFNKNIQELRDSGQFNKDN